MIREAIPTGLVLDQHILKLIFDRYEDAACSFDEFSRLTEGLQAADLNELITDFLGRNLVEGEYEVAKRVASPAILEIFLTEADVSEIFQEHGKEYGFKMDEFDEMIRHCKPGSFLEFLLEMIQIPVDFSSLRNWRVKIKVCTLLDARKRLLPPTLDEPLDLRQRLPRVELINTVERYADTTQSLLMNTSYQMDRALYLKGVYDFAQNVGLEEVDALRCVTRASERLPFGKKGQQTCEGEIIVKAPRKRSRGFESNGCLKTSKSLDSGSATAIVGKSGPQISSLRAKSLDLESSGTVFDTRIEEIGHEARALIRSLIIDLKDRSSVDDHADILDLKGDRSRYGKAQKKRTPTPRKTTTLSNHFPRLLEKEPKKRRLPAGTSCIAVPPLSSPTFGLIQEELADQPFQLLLAVLFLNKTKGESAIPVFRSIIARYPKPLDLASAEFSDILDMIKHLGFQNQRAGKLIALAKVWIADPPVKGRRFRTLNYPYKGAQKGIKPSEVLPEDDEREAALEIGHLPGCGAYAFDSWRIFCRDQLRGRADGWNGHNATSDFEPEWKRVVPLDKELRAFLRWQWLKEGWDWDPLTGEKQVADQSLVNAVNTGNYAWDNKSTLI